MSEAISLPAGSVDMNALHDACMLKSDTAREKALEKVLAKPDAAPETAPVEAIPETPDPVGVE
jgi:hypothetical protein